MEIRLIDVEETYPVRQVVLRPGLPPETCRFGGDSDPGAFHLGAFRDGALAAVASFAPGAFPPDAADLLRPASPDTAQAGAQRLAETHPHKLRGMAVLPRWQGRGLGRYLLEAAYPLLGARGCTLLWCNARSSALGFYRHAGFTAVGEEFETQYAGPHYLMYRWLEAAKIH